MYYCSSVFVLVMFAACSSAVLADPPAADPGQKDQLASHLAAELKLARYATYNAVGINTRAIAERVAAAIQQRAADQQIQLPTAMNDADRQFVRSLERLQGDDFDMTYLSLVHNPPHYFHCPADWE